MDPSKWTVASPPSAQRTLRAAALVFADDDEGAPPPLESDEGANAQCGSGVCDLPPSDASYEPLTPLSSNTARSTASAPSARADVLPVGLLAGLTLVPFATPLPPSPSQPTTPPPPSQPATPRQQQAAAPAIVVVAPPSPPALSPPAMSPAAPQSPTPATGKDKAEPLRAFAVGIRTCKRSGDGLMKQLKELAPRWAPHGIDAVAPTTAPWKDVPKESGWSALDLARAHDHLHALAVTLAADPPPQLLVISEDGVSFRTDVCSAVCARGAARPQGFAIAWVPGAIPKTTPSPTPDVAPSDAAALALPAAGAAASAAATASSSAADKPKRAPGERDETPRKNYEPRATPPPTPPMSAEPRSLLAYALPRAMAQQLVARYLRADAAATLAALPPAAKCWEDVLASVGWTSGIDEPGAALLGFMRSEHHPWRSTVQATQCEIAVRADVVDPLTFWHCPSWSVRDAVARGLKRKRIGVMVGPQDVFSNGCLQNSVFILDALTHAGYAADAVMEVSSTSVMKWAPFCEGIYGPDRVIHPMRLDSDDANDFQIMIWGSVTPSKDFADYARARNVVTVGFKCGNSTMLDMEAWIQCGNEHRRNYDPLGDAHQVKVSDAVWTVELLWHGRMSTQMMTQLPVYKVPHLWSPSIFALRHHLDGARAGIKDRPLPYWESAGRAGPEAGGIDIFITEPNLSYVKNSWIPLHICARLQQLHPGLLNSVEVFCAPDTEVSYQMVKFLPHIGHEACKARREAAPKSDEGMPLNPLGREEKGQLINLYGRTPVTQILEKYARSERPAIWLSTTLHNQGNYTALEAFFFGFPLVHNSRLYNKHGVSGVAPLGYYYEMSEDLWDLDGAVASILDAAKNHPHNLVAQRVAASQYLAAKSLPDSALVLGEFVGTMQGTIDEVLATREQRDSQARPHLKTWGVGV